MKLAALLVLILLSCRSAPKVGGTVTLKNGGVFHCVILIEGPLLYTCDIPRDSVAGVRR